MTFSFQKAASNIVHGAVMSNNLKALADFKKKGVDFSVQDENGATPLDLYFYNHYRLDEKILDLLIDAKADFGTNASGYSNALTRAINLKKWAALDKILDYTSAAMTKYHLDRIVTKLSDDNHYWDVQKSVVKKALDMMLEDFDRADYQDFVCKTVYNTESCKKLFDEHSYGFYEEHLIEGAEFIDLHKFDELVQDLGDEYGYWVA